MNIAKKLQQISLQVGREKAPNGSIKKYPIVGTKNLCTDSIGHAAFEELKKQYVGGPGNSRKMLRDEVTKLFDALKKQGSLFRRDGTLVI